MDDPCRVWPKDGWAIVQEAVWSEGVVFLVPPARIVRERYGQMSDQELIKAINLMTLDNGETEAWLSSPK
jgi:hypothetical protein